MGPSPPTCLPLRSSLWRCTTSLSQRLSPETTLASTSRTSLSRTSREDMSPPTPRTSQHLESLTSLLRSSFLTTLVRLAMDTALSLIVTQLTLLASLLRSRRRLIVVLVSQLKTTPSLSSLVMPLLFSSPPASQCVSKPSLIILHLEDSLFVT